jgi:hypothetical protein
MLTTLALSLLLSQVDVTPPPPPPLLEAPAAPAMRSASLIRAELAEIDAELDKIKFKPAWVPVVLGFGGITLATALGVLVVFVNPGGWAGLAFILVAWVALAVAGIASVVVGSVIGGVNARRNQANEARAIHLRQRKATLEEELSRMRSELEPWRGGLADVTPLTTVFTF